MNRNCKSTATSQGHDKKSSKSNRSHETTFKSLQESAKAKKLRSLNESLIRNESEQTSLIKYNHTSPSSNSGTTAFLTKVKKSIKGLVNHDYCSYCDEGGDLLNCDRCPASFHLLCTEPPLSLDQIPTGEFLCNKCNARAELLTKEASVDSGNSNETNLPVM